MNRKNGLKLLMTADPVSEAWFNSLDLAKLLQPFQVNITLAISGGFLKKSHAKEAAQLDNLDIVESNYRPEWLHNAWDYNDIERTEEWLLELEELHWPDVVHLNSYVYASIPWQTPVLLSCQYCPTSRWKNMNRGQIYNRNYHDKVQNGIRAADIAVTSSWQILQHLESQFGILPNKQVIPPVRDNTAFYISEKDAFVFCVFPFAASPKDSFWYETVSANLKAPIFIAGEEKPLFLTGKDTRSVYFLGNIDRKGLSYWMARAAVFASPFRHHSFAPHLLEAAYAGCALITGDTPVIREFWENSAVYIATDDPIDFANSCNRLLDDRELRKKIANQAILKTKQYSPETMPHAYFNLYKQLAIPDILQKPQEDSLHL